MAEQYILEPWKNYIFHMITEDDFPKIMQHLQDHFVKDDPVNVVAGSGESWDENRLLDIKDKIIGALKSGLGFYLVDKDTNEVIAVNLISDSRQPLPFYPANPHSPITVKIRNLLSQLQKDTKWVLHKNYKYNYHADIFITSVHTAYRFQGIATEMYLRTCKFLKAKGFKLVTSSFSSPGTRAVGRKLGFEELERIYFKDHLDGNKQKVFPEAGNDEFVVQTVKIL